MSMVCIALSAAVTLCGPTTAQAQIFTSYPYTLQNGTIADAGQVMADFNQIANQVNANAAKNGINSDISTLAGLGNGSATLPSLAFVNFVTSGLFYDTVNLCIGVTSVGLEVGCWNSTGLHQLPSQTTPADRDAATVGYVNSKQGVLAPQLRLSASSTQYLPSSNVTASGAIYYVPYDGTTAIYTDGAGNVFSTQLPTTLSQLLSDTTLSPAAAAPATVYDVYFWYYTSTTFTGLTSSTTNPTIITTIGGISGGANSLVAGASITGPGIPAATTITSIDSATQIHISNAATASGTGTFSVSASLIKTFVISRGPAWSTQTSRGTAAALTSIQNGAYWVNNVDIVNGPKATAGMHIGTIVTDSAGATVSWIYGGSANGGLPATFGVFNRYNRLPVSTAVKDAAIWSYNVVAWRQAHGSTGNSVVFVSGVNDENFNATYSIEAFNNNTACRSYTAIGFDVVNSPGFSQAGDISGLGSAAVNISSHLTMQPTTPGAHFVAPIELVDCGTGSYNGIINFIQLGGFFFNYRM